MADNVLVVSPLQKRAWIDKMTKQIISFSCWETLSSRNEKSVTSGNEKNSVPDAVIQYVSDKFNRGTMFTTIPSMDKLKKKGVGGFQIAKGTEESPTLRYARVFYNVKRKAVTFADGSVEGDATEALEILSQKNELVGDYFAELNDYDKQRAIVLGADEFLTQAEYWTGVGSNFSSPQVQLKLHPNTVIIGQTNQSNPAGYSATFKTNIGNLVTACNYTGVAARRFTKLRLDAVCRYADKKILPLGWSSGGNTVTHVIKISPEMANQLQFDTTTSGAANWWATMTAGGARGVDNRAISNVLGIYMNKLILIDQRAPLFDCRVYSSVATGDTTDSDATALARFQFVKPWSDTVALATAIDAGDNRVPVVKADGTDANSGTMEIGMILGRGAIGVAEVRKLAYHTDKEDYDFREGFEARKSDGNMRMDFTNEDYAPNAWSSLAAYANNWTSAIFLCPTTAAAM